MRLSQLLPCTALLLSATMATLQGAEARPHPKRQSSNSSTRTDRKAILRFLKSDLSRTTVDHEKLMSYSVTSLDIQNGWALAQIQPTRREALDAFKVLLRKRGGHWKTVTLGTGFYGVGKEYGVPHRLWKRWGI